MILQGRVCNVTAPESAEIRNLQKGVGLGSVKDGWTHPSHRIPIVLLPPVTHALFPTSEPIGQAPTPVCLLATRHGPCPLMRGGLTPCIRVDGEG